MGDNGAPNKYKLIFFSDVHFGNKLCSKKLFQNELINQHKDNPLAYFFDLGDGCDMIVAQGGDKRYKASQVDPDFVGVDNPVDRQIQGYCELLEPIKDRILGMWDGNHHLTILDKCGTNPTRRIGASLWGYDAAEARLLGYSGFVVLYFDYHGLKGNRSRKIVINGTHGIGTSGKTEGGFITSLGKDADNYDADIHCFGHNHALAGWDRIKIGVDRDAKRITSRKEIRINCGTFLKAFSDDTSTSYAEKSRFKPSELGFMEVNVKFTKNAEEIYYVKRSFL